MSNLISRDDALDAVEFGITYARVFNKETGEVKELFQESNDELRKAVERIKQLPTIQPKRGRWIEDKGQQTLMKNFIERGEVWRVCSVCGAGYMIGHKYECDKAYHETYHNFCPNCGAKMEVNHESN